MLLRSAGPCPLDVLDGIACDTIEARYVLAGLTEVQHDSLRRTIEVEVTIAMAALHVLGLAGVGGSQPLTCIPCGGVQVRHGGALGRMGAPRLGGRSGYSAAEPGADPARRAETAPGGEPREGR